MEGIELSFETLPNFTQRDLTAILWMTPVGFQCFHCLPFPSSSLEYSSNFAFEASILCHSDAP